MGATPTPRKCWLARGIVTSSSRDYAANSDQHRRTKEAIFSRTRPANHAREAACQSPQFGRASGGSGQFRAVAARQTGKRGRLHEDFRSSRSRHREMPPEPTADEFVAALASGNRVVLLGGLAVIAYGLDRTTRDVDLWLDPIATAQQWALRLTAVVAEFEGLRFWSLARRCFIPETEIVEEISEIGVIRLSGLDREVDVFRVPNELQPENFEEVWSKGKTMRDGTRLPDELDLYITKANTGRDRDRQDQLFLESLVRTRFRERLPVCELSEAQLLLGRFLDPEVLQFALDNPNGAVRDLALRHLQEFAAEGDPYSRDILVAWQARTEF